MRKPPPGASIYGIDIGKSLFHVVGADATGKPILRVKFKRDTVLAFFTEAPRALIGMEACPGAQWLARKLQSLGHTVRIIPAAFVKPYVKSNKNDTADAEAIAEAVTRPTMRFVELKTSSQVDVQALHRVRDAMVGTRTRMICQMRAFCLEYGVPIRQGAGVFKVDLPRVLDDVANDLSPMMRDLLRGLFSDLQKLETRIREVTQAIEALAHTNEVARRLTTVPGIGPLSATALLAAIGSAARFHKARDLAAWIGLVPKQYSTGGKPNLLGISKRDNPYIRRLLIHGARSVMIHMDRSRDRLGAWIDDLRKRMHVNKVVVALANKIARIAWVLLTKPGALYQRVPVAA
jgi:transposase